MDALELRKILYSVLFWFLTDYCLMTLLHNVFYYTKTRNCRAFVFSRTALRESQTMFCVLVLMANLRTVSKIDSLDSLLNPTNVVSKIDAATYAKISPAFIFVLTYLIYRMLKSLTLEQINAMDILKHLFFTYIFWVGYALNFMAVTFPVGILFGISVSMSNIFKKLRDSKQRFLRQLFLVIFCCYWMFVHLRLIPFTFVRSLFILSHDKSDDIFVQSFRTFFMIYYSLEVLTSPLLRYKKMIAKDLKNGFKFNTSLSRNKKDEDTKDAEDHISAFIAQGRPSEVKKQMALMQMVKCVIALQKKSKKIREKTRMNNEQNADDLDLH